MIVKDRKSLIIFKKYSITIHLYIFIHISRSFVFYFFLLISHYTSLCNRMCAWLRSSSIRMPSICSSCVTIDPIDKSNRSNAFSCKRPITNSTLTEKTPSNKKKPTYEKCSQVFRSIHRRQHHPNRLHQIILDHRQWCDNIKAIWCPPHSQVLTISHVTNKNKNKLLLI